LLPLIAARLTTLQSFNVKHTHSPPPKRRFSLHDKWKYGIEFAELSDVGMRRSNNQDSYVSVLAKSKTRFESHGHLFVVADGMGAHAAGELASQLATEHICRSYFHVETVNEHSLEAAFHQANREIYGKGQSNPEFHNMGTTASGLLLNLKGAFIAHVGDSRVYRLRNECLEQLTFDHSLVWEIEANPELQATSWSGPIPKNVITRSLGPNATVQVDIEGPFDIEANDRFLLCSDGLTAVVDDEEIGTLVGCLDPENAAQVLIDLANLRGGPDNITVTVVHPKANEDDGNQSLTPKPNPALPKPLLYSTICTFLTAAALTALSLGSQKKFLPFAIVAVTVGAILGIGCLALRSSRSKRTTNSKLPKGRAPYRSYNARPSLELYDRLGQTVQALRDASAEHNWLMEWESVDRCQAEGEKQITEGDASRAIQSQSLAIIEAMKQLREQQNRAASDTSIDL